MSQDGATIPVVKETNHLRTWRVTLRERTPRDSVGPLDHKTRGELIAAKFLLKPTFQEGYRVRSLHPLRETSQAQVVPVEMVL